MTQALKLLNPILLIAVILGYAPFMHSPFAGGKFFILQVVLSIFLLTIAIETFIHKKISIYNPFKSKFFQIGLAIFGLLLFYTLFSQTPVISLNGNLDRYMGMHTYTLLFCIFTINSIFLKPSEKTQVLQTSLKTFNIVATISALYGLFQFLGFDFLFSSFNDRIFQGRLYSFSGNPSLLAQLLCISTIYNITQLTKNKKSKYFLLIQIPILILTQTRSSILTFILIAPFLVAKKLKKHLIWIILLIVLVAGLNFQKISNSNSLQSRFQIWNSTIQLIKQKPLGYGIENIQTFFPLTQTPKFNTLEDNIYKTADKIHNQTLSIAYSSGPLGIILYISIIFFLIKNLKDPTTKITSVLILTNILQNQLNFMDLPTMLSLVIFSSLNTHQTREIKKTIHHQILTMAFAILSIFICLNAFSTFQLSYHYKQYKTLFNTNYQISQQHLQTALNTNPNYPKLWIELGYSNLNQRLETFQNLKRLESPAPQSAIWLAKHIENNNPVAANQILTDLLAQNPKNPIWTLELLMHQKRTNNPDFQTNFEHFQSLFPQLWNPPFSHKTKTFINNFPEFKKIN